MTFLPMTFVPSVWVLQLKQREAYTRLKIGVQYELKQRETHTRLILGFSMNALIKTERNAHRVKHWGSV
jgi:hypothetical protein